SMIAERLANPVKLVAGGGVENDLLVPIPSPVNPPDHPRPASRVAMESRLHTQFRLLAPRRARLPDAELDLHRVRSAPSALDLSPPYVLRLATMADALQSARDKLARGDSHRAITRREVRGFFKRHPDPTFKVKPEGDLDRVNVGDIWRASIVVDQGVPDLPASFAARFGDVLHNYRCVLD